MAAETPMCKVCFEAYNEHERRPKIVPCRKHTVCLSCLKYYQIHEGRIRCSECQVIYWETPEELSDNLTIIGMLEDLNLRCATHDTRAITFCSDHFITQCGKCTDHASCKLLDIVESSQEINFSAIEKILELQRKVEAAGTRVPPTIALKMRDCRREILKTNYSTYLSLLQLFPQVSCDRCKMRNGLLLERLSFEVSCNLCLTPGSDSRDFITLDDEEAAITQLSIIVKKLLIGVNVEELTPESLRGFKTIESLSLLKIIQLAKPLANKWRYKTSYENLPSEFLCLNCDSLLSKSSSQVRELPCRGMHVICEDCYSKMNPALTVCPLDGNIYGYSPASLTQDPVPQYQAVDLAGYQPVQYQPELPPVRPAEVPRPTPPSSQVKRDTDHPSTPMPHFQPPINQHYIDHFGSVIPYVGLPESRMTADVKGWTIQRDRNQVEAIVIQCFGDVQLQGIAVSNPITMGVIAKLVFIKIYSSKSPKGRPIFEQTTNVDLLGGNSILTYVQLSRPVQIPAFQKLSMKIKIVVPAGRGNVMLYRGNSFDCPETWNGSDHTTWEFEEVKATDLEKDEYYQAQNSYSGPILRFIYST